jgi:hypothetical protein
MDCYYARFSTDALIQLKTAAGDPLLATMIALLGAQAEIHLGPARAEISAHRRNLPLDLTVVISPV